jgi:translation initiation factor IF-3
LSEALRHAEDRGQDLVEIAPGATPPVCKILDFSKYRYEKEKQRKEAKKHQKGGHVKEVRFRPKIGEHDFNTKLGFIHKFLDKRDKVRVIVMFHGREMEHRDLGENIIKRIKESLDGKAAVETAPQLLGNRLIIMLAPK